MKLFHICQTSHIRMSKHILRIQLEISDLVTLVQKVYNEVNRVTK